MPFLAVAATIIVKSGIGIAGSSVGAVVIVFYEDEKLVPL
jgi:hypothetical protein